MRVPWHFEPTVAAAVVGAIGLAVLAGFAASAGALRRRRSRPCARNGADGERDPRDLAASDCSPAARNSRTRSPAGNWPRKAAFTSYVGIGAPSTSARQPSKVTLRPQSLARPHRRTSSSFDAARMRVTSPFWRISSVSVPDDQRHPQIHAARESHGFLRTGGGALGATQNNASAFRSSRSAGVLLAPTRRQGAGISTRAPGEPAHTANVSKRTSAEGERNQPAEVRRGGRVSQPGLRGPARAWVVGARIHSPLNAPRLGAKS